MGIALVVSGIGSLLIALPNFLSGGNDNGTGVNGQVDQGDLCQTEKVGRSDQCTEGQGSRDWLGVSIIFLGIFLSGFGISFYYSFGLPYVDDNSEKDKSPLR